MTDLAPLAAAVTLGGIFGALWVSSSSNPRDWCYPTAALAIHAFAGAVIGVLILILVQSAR